MIALLERFDVFDVPQYKTDVVQPLEQTLLVVRIDVEAVCRAFEPRNNRGAKSIVLA